MIYSEINSAFSDCMDSHYIILLLLSQLKKLILLIHISDIPRIPFIKRIFCKNLIRMRWDYIRNKNFFINNTNLQNIITKVDK